MLEEDEKSVGISSSKRAFLQDSVLIRFEGNARARDSYLLPYDIWYLSFYHMDKWHCVLLNSALSSNALSFLWYQAGSMIIED